MKKEILTLIFAGILGAQFSPDTVNNIGGGMGVSVIDGNPYIAFNLMTELTFGRFGVGLNIPLLFSPKEGIKKDDWDSKRDYARIISYIRYGHKGSPLYVRLGALNFTTLGHGFLVYNYSNRVRSDVVKIGMEVSIDRGLWGMEFFNSDFGRMGLVGARGTIRPFVGVPIAERLEIGASYVRDFDPDEKKETHDGISAFGFDAGFPVFEYSFLSTEVYADYGKIVDNGHGAAEGIIFQLSGLGLLDLSLKFEERQLSPHFLPAYFDRMYEVDKFGKAALLDSITEGVNGTFGELYGEALGKLRAYGNFFHKKGVKNSGVLNLFATTGTMFPLFTVNWRYFKDRIETAKDLFSIDERSILFTELGYRVNPYVTVYMVITRRYRFDDQAGTFKPEDSYSIRADFNWKF